MSRQTPMRTIQPVPALITTCIGLLVAGCAKTGHVEKSTVSTAVTRPAAPSPSTFALKDGRSPLFDGKSLQGWQVLTEGPFSGHGPVEVKDGAIVLGRGGSGTGVRWQGPFPREDYEVTLEAMRVDGMDFFCGMTFPVGDEPCTLILGGWGGCIVGLSNVDGAHAAENQTTTGMNFENGRWYKIRLIVMRNCIQVWIDDARKIYLDRADHRFDVWYEQEPARPFGFATWETTGALCDIRVRELPN